MITKEEIIEIAFKLASNPEILHKRILSTKQSYLDVVKGEFITRLITNALSNKKNLFELVCGMNYILNNLRTTEPELILYKDIYKELLTYREDLIKYKIEGTL